MKKETRSLLKTRAIAMAKEPEQRTESSAKLELITFSLSGEEYGIESVYVREVYPLKDFTPLPGVPNYILGLIQVRRQILTVVDLKKFLNLPESGLGELNKVIILSDDHMEFGILADLVHGTQTINLEEIKMAPPTVSGIGEEYLKGITKERVIVLDAARLLGDKSLIVNDELN